MEKPGMKKRLLAVAMLLLGVSVFNVKTTLAAKTETRFKPTAASVIAFALADVRHKRSEMMKTEKWSASTWMKVKYVQVTAGNKGFIYNGKRQLIHTRKWKSKSSTAGIVGDYAEVQWELLNKDKEIYSDIFGQQVVNFNGRGWVVVAHAGTADGYGDQLEKAKVPAWVIKRLLRR
jgi:hypothetical protein